MILLHLSSCPFTIILLLFILILTSSPLVYSQTQGNVTLITEELFDVLQRLNATQFRNLTELFLSSPEGNEYITQLSTGNHTIFAVEDSAVIGLPTSVKSDPSQLATIFSYHHIFGTVELILPTYPNTTIRQTALNSSSLQVFLEGGKDQVIGLSHGPDIDREFSFLDQPPILESNDAFTLVGSGSNTVMVFVISGFFNIPGPLSSANIAQKSSNSIDVFRSAGLLDIIQSSHGVTVFLPSDDAIMNSPQNLIALSLTNPQALMNILKNHIINGTTLYTPNFISMGLSSTDAISTSGESLGFSTNSSGTFVHSFNSTAGIIQPDIILENGVVHIVDTVLLNDMAAPDIASSAYVSATRAAAASANETQTGPIGFTPSPTPAPTQSGAARSGAARKPKLVDMDDGRSLFGFMAVIALGWFLSCSYP